MQTLPVVDVGALEETFAPDEVVRVQSARHLDPGLQLPKIRIHSYGEAFEHGPGQN